MIPRSRIILNRLFPGLCPAPLKYQGAAVVLQEVPDEISLAISVSGCPRNCPGCHSPQLAEYKGRWLCHDLDYLIGSNPGITCVCFMGGEQNPGELARLFRRVRNRHHLRTCLYTGESSPDAVALLILDLCPDYIKFGEYIEELGPLTSPATNQRMYSVSYPYGYDSAGILHDITGKFHRSLDTPEDAAS